MILKLLTTTHTRTYTSHEYSQSPPLPTIRQVAVVVPLRRYKMTTSLPCPLARTLVLARCLPAPTAICLGALPQQQGCKCVHIRGCRYTVPTKAPLTLSAATLHASASYGQPCAHAHWRMSRHDPFAAKVHVRSS